LLAPSGGIEEIIAIILSQNHALQHYLRQRLDSLQEIGAVSMDEPDEGMNLAIFNA
jgi:chorismate mutase